MPLCCIAVLACSPAAAADSVEANDCGCVVHGGAAELAPVCIPESSHACIIGRVSAYACYRLCMRNGVESMPDTNERYTVFHTKRAN